MNYYEYLIIEAHKNNIIIMNMNDVKEIYLRLKRFTFVVNEQAYNKGERISAEEVEFEYPIYIRSLLRENNIKFRILQDNINDLKTKLKENDVKYMSWEDFKTFLENK